MPLHFFWLIPSARGWCECEVSGGQGRKGKKQRNVDVVLIIVDSTKILTWSLDLAAQVEWAQGTPQRCIAGTCST